MRPVDLYALISTTRLFLFLVAIFCFSISLLNSIFTMPMVTLFLLALWARCKYVYVNESFTRYYDGILFFFFVLIFTVFFGGAFYIAKTVFAWEAIFCFFLGLSLPLVMGIWYFYAKHRAPAPLNYQVRDGRVYPIQRFQRLSSLAIGAMVGVSLVVVSFFQGSSLYAAFILSFLVVSSLIVMFYIQGAIADLQKIKSDERRLGVRYAFGNLEEIQAWRKSAWAPRLFRYFYER